MAQEQQGGGNPFIMPSLISAGGSLLQSLAQSIFGSGDRDRLRRFAEFLKSRMGQQVLPAGQQEAMVQRSMASMAPQMNQYAEGLNRKLNLDSGVSQGALAERIFPTQMAMRNDLAMKNVEMNNDNDRYIQGLLAQIYGQQAAR